MTKVESTDDEDGKQIQLIYTTSVYRRYVNQLTECGDQRNQFVLWGGILSSVLLPI